MLGCCVHYDHSCCESHGMSATVQQADDDCSHGHENGHHHHYNDADSSGENAENGCGYQHHRSDGHQHECDHGDCNFTSVQRTSDLELMLTISMWCQTLCKVFHTDALDSLVALNLAALSPPDPLLDSGTARAISQVWRL